MKKAIFLSLLSIAGASQCALAPFAALATSGGASALSLPAAASGGGWFAALTAAALGAGLGSQVGGGSDSGQVEVNAGPSLDMSSSSSSAEAGFSNLQKGIAAAGILAAVAGMTYMYMNSGNGKEEAKRKATEMALAFSVLGLSQYMPWKLVEKEFEKLKTDIYASARLSSDEQDELVAQKQQAFDKLKEFQAKGELPSQVMLKIAEDAADDADTNRSRRQKAIEDFERKMKPPVQAPASPEVERQAMQVLKGLLPALAQLKAMA